VVLRVRRNDISRRRRKVLILRFHMAPSGPRSLAWALGLFCAALLCAPREIAAVDPPQNVLTTPQQAISQFAIADFDGDTRPDLATVQGGNGDSGSSIYWIAFRLSSGQRRSLGVTAPPGGLQIASLDVNADGFVDVVVTTLWTNQPVAVLLNDGQGNFRVSSPSAYPSAFKTSNESWSLNSVGIGDASALLLSTFRTWGSSKATESSLHRSAARLPDFAAGGNLPFSTAVPFPIRAPPSLTHFI